MNHKILSIQLSIFLSFVTFFCCAQSDKEAILQNFERQETCWNRGDIDCYCEAYINSDSVRMISQYGIVYGLENIKSMYKGWNKENMGTLNFSEMVMEKLSDNYYFVTGKFHVAFDDSRKPHEGYFSVIMKKENEKWLIWADHS